MSVPCQPFIDVVTASQDRDANVCRALEIARSALSVEVAWVAEFVGGQQVFTHVLADRDGIGPEQGSTLQMDRSFGSRVRNGLLPAVITNAVPDPMALGLEVTRAFGIAAYAGVPINHPDGTARGMLCCANGRPAPWLEAGDLTRLDMLAKLIGALIDDTGADENVVRQTRVLKAIAGAGRGHALQPIVDIRTGRAEGVEALARFEDPPHAPDRWFAEAEMAGLRAPLEMAAAHTALARLADQTGYISINLSPDLITDRNLTALLSGIDCGRVVLEVTEHAPVHDYEALAAALAPHRQAGLRMSVDDAGAGYASFRHILQVHPEYIKIDISIVRDINVDPVRQALTASLVAFSRTAGAELIAEGVETQAELDVLARLGVTLMQGYLFIHPCSTPPPEGYPTPSRHVVINAAADLALVVAEAVRNGHDMEQIARPLLDAVLALTGLETSYLAILHPNDELEHRFVRNAGSIHLPEGFTIPWATSLCKCMRDNRRIWTNDAATDLVEQSAATLFGLATYLSVPLTDEGGGLIGTLCAASRDSLFISDATVVQVQLIAYVLSVELIRPSSPSFRSDGSAGQRSYPAHGGSEWRAM